MKNRKGFTLIEIMIVVAIIGILALVLVPKIGGMKNQAKLAGMDTNSRVAQAVVQRVINDFSATQLNELDAALLARLPGDTVNPFTDATGPLAYSEVTDATPTSAAFATGYVNAGAHEDLTGVDFAAQAANLKGVIVLSSYADGSQVKVDLLPFDDNGAPMKVVTITK